MADKVIDALANRILELEHIEQIHRHKQDRFIVELSNDYFLCRVNRAINYFNRTLTH